MAWTGCPARTRSRSARSSSAEAYRFAGFFARQRITTASRSAGTSGASVEGGVGASFTCLYATATGESPENGGRPVSIS